MTPGIEEFDDLRLGPMAQEPAAQCGDLLVRDRLGQWTYQFAVVVDDMEQGIDVVIRGEDLLSSTGRQIRLGRLLGRDRPPSYLHHPLILKPDGSKLSKSAGDTGIRELREEGVHSGGGARSCGRACGADQRTPPLSLAGAHLSSITRPNDRVRSRRLRAMRARGRCPRRRSCRGCGLHTTLGDITVAVDTDQRARERPPISCDMWTPACMPAEASIAR